MRPNDIKATLKALIQLNRTVCVEGPVGVGKTSIIQEVTKQLGLHYVERHLPTMPVEDMGVPMVDKDTLYYKLPDWFPAKGSALDDGIGGVLCFDDRNQAGNDLQKVLANICQARNLHGVQLADNWTVISTGNRQSDRAGANRVLSHLRNRETVIEYEAHLDDWTTWAIENDINPVVVAFIRYRPNLLNDFDPQRDCNPTPRSWSEGVSPILGAVPAHLEYDIIKGAVGEGAAAEFVGFVRIYRKLPNPDAILMSPTTSEVPSDPATLYALSGALAERASASNFDRVCTYAERMPPEFSVLTISYAARKKPDLASTAAFTNWAVKHQDVLF